LRELYARTLAHLRRGPDLAGTDHSALVARRKARAAALRGETATELAAWYGGMPDRYFAQTPPEAIARHVGLSRRRRAGEALVDAVHHPRLGWSELTVIADDAPGLLGRIAGVLLAARVDVMSAQITNRQLDETHPAEAVDVFHVRDRYGRAIDDARARAIAADLGRVLGGEVTVEALIESRRERSALKAPIKPRVPTEIHIDNDVSGEYTVIDVFAQDRPGVLYAITHTLSGLGLDIGLSKVATEADRVADVFYVRHDDGRKLAPAAATEVRDALAGALAALVAST
jgi:[protein-PII] uridylyltransferase